MSGCSSLHLRIFPKRQLFPQRVVSQTSLRHVSVHATSRETPHFEPTPSQRLRFALTGSTQPVQNRSPKPESNQKLQDLLFEEWPFNTPPPPLWGSSAPKKELDTEMPSGDQSLSHIQTIRQLQAYVERYVNGAESSAVLGAENCKHLRLALERCQQSSSDRELLSAINGIIERLERLHAQVPSCIYVLGMRHAFLCLSAPALKHHLKGFHHANSEKLDTETSVLLVNTFFASLQSRKLADPDYDATSIINLVTGEEGNTPYNLHAHLCWAGTKGSMEHLEKYFPLLMLRRGRGQVTKLWKRLIDTIDSSSPSHLFQSAYTCMMLMSNAKKPETAIPYLKQISEGARKTLPGISEFQHLGTLLADAYVSKVLPQLAGEQESLKILDKYLRDMERQLGISWQAGSSFHTSISNPLRIASGLSLMTMDGDSVGFESNERLVAEIKALGCSKSASDLGRVASLLDEHDGSEIPVSLTTAGDTAFEFSWFPQRSPIEFSNSLPPTEINRSLPWSSRTLGLVRARADNNGTPVPDKHALHLMQLGYLNLRSSPRSDEAKGGAERCPWQETGHVVTWDRATGQLLAVFVGKGHGLIEPGLQCQSLRPTHGLGVISRITLSGDLAYLSPSIPTPFLGSSTVRYHFDVDPEPHFVS